ncbi:MAG: hypothetical protein JO069_18050 [Verrucomicrobia bacterium]|nr:hypothetical protein [Verrucomicrobiota bacterium]
MDNAPDERMALLNMLMIKSRSKTELLKTGAARRQAREAALKELVAQGRVVKIQNRYFLDEPPGSLKRLIQAETSRLDEHLRSLPELVSRSGMKIRRGLKDPALVVPALEALLAEGRVVQLRYNREKLCVHTAHLPVPAPSEHRVSSSSSSSARSAEEENPSLSGVHRAYERVRARQLGSAVFISDLAAELKVPIPKIHDWIQKEVIAAGHGSLDEGHWPTATETQRAAAIEHLGSKRLLIRF